MSIHLNEQQRRELEQGQPVQVLDEDTKQAYILLRPEEFERLKKLVYDDSPWTDTEKEQLAWEAGQSLGWDDMDEYDNYEKKS